MGIFRLDQNACPALGLQNFIRSDGKPVDETVTFELNPQLVGPFTLNLINGSPDGSHRVDSATISLNGALVFDPNNFSEQTSSLSQVVSLQPTNTLSVQIRGAPGDLLSIEITGYDNTPPSVTITSPSSGQTFQTSPITVSGTVDDSQASVTVNGITTTVAYDGSFTMEGIILQEGENPIKVIAVDSCGNQGEDQIAVYLRTVPQGPQLTVCPEPFRERVPRPPGPDCSPQAIVHVDIGTVAGLTDETAVSIILNGILMPDGVLIIDQGDIDWGMRDGDFFWAFILLPPVDGIYPVTVVATDIQGNLTQSTTYFVLDTIPPTITLTLPIEGFVTNTPTMTIAGMVDDPDAMIRIGWYGPWIPVVNMVFTGTFTLSKEGPYYLSVSATDPAGNFSSVLRRVILDTIPPQININTPVQDAKVNTPTIQVAGTLIDQNIETISIAVNNGQPQLLTLSGSNFSGVVTLMPGINTLAFSARDKAGNTSSVTRTVLLDLGPPIVSIISPQSGAVISGTLTVQVDANDTVSGVGSVSLFVDGQIFSTMSQPPFNFLLDTSSLATGSHTITARAVDNASNLSEASITVSVPERIGIEITSPSNGATINKSTALIQGTIYNYVGEVGVTVNGFLAEVQGSDFALIVPLQVGQNILTAIATTADGFQAQTSVIINTASQQEIIRLTATPSSGIIDTITNVFSVTFEAEAYLPYPVSSYSWDFNGDGAPEITVPDPQVIAQYQYPGLYFPRVTVTDNQGNVYTETTIVNVLSREEMDALLRSKWEGMKEALKQGNISSALNYFVTDSREEYQEIFELLASQLPSLISAMTEINMVEITGNMAEYYIMRFQKGVDISYFIYFMRDENGIWRISSF